LKIAGGCAAQIILLLIAAGLLAIPLACLSTLTAPLHSPGFAAQILCPEGSQLEGEWYQATYDEPGERSLSVSCVDSQGNPVPANPRDERTLVSGTRLYFPVCFVPILVVGGIVLLAVNGGLWTLRRRTGNKSGVGQ